MIDSFPEVCSHVSNPKNTKDNLKILHDFANWIFGNLSETKILTHDILFSPLSHKGRPPPVVFCPLFKNLQATHTWKFLTFLDFCCVLTFLKKVKFWGLFQAKHPQNWNFIPKNRLIPFSIWVMGCARKGEHKSESCNRIQA